MRGWFLIGPKFCSSSPSHFTRREVALPRVPPLLQTHNRITTKLYPYIHFLLDLPILSHTSIQPSSRVSLNFKPCITSPPSNIQIDIAISVGSTSRASRPAEEGQLLKNSSTVAKGANTSRSLMPSRISSRTVTSTAMTRAWPSRLWTTPT